VDVIQLVSLKIETQHKTAPLLVNDDRGLAVEMLTDRKFRFLLLQVVVPSCTVEMTAAVTSQCFVLPEILSISMHYWMYLILKYELEFYLTHLHLLTPAGCLPNIHYIIKIETVCQVTDIVMYICREVLWYLVYIMKSLNWFYVCILIM